MRKEQKQKWIVMNRKRVLLFVFFIAIALLGAATFFVTQKNRWLGKEYDRREEFIGKTDLLAGINLKIREAESDARGFVLTGNKIFIAGIDKTIDSINKATRQILLLHSSPAEHKHTLLFSRLDSLVKLRVALLQEAVLLAEADKKKATEHIATARGKQLTDQVAAVSNEIVRDYEKEIRLSEKGFWNEVSNSNAFVYLSMAVALLLILVSFYFLLKEIDTGKKLRNELRQQKEYLSTTLTSMAEGLITTDEAGRIVYMNPAAEILTGWKTTEAKNQPLHKVYDVFSESSGQPVDNIVSKILRYGKPVEFENNTILKTRYNSDIIIENSGTPLFDANKQVTGALLVFSDNTEKKRIEKKLQQREKYLRDIIQNLPEPVYTCDADGYIQLYNKAAAELWGQEPKPGRDQWTGAWKVLRPEDKTEIPRDLIPMAIVVRNKIPVYGEQIIIQRPDGSLRHVITYPTPLFDEDGKLTGALNMQIDITDRKEREIMVKKTEAKYQNLVEQASDAIVIYSLDGTIYEFNKAASQLTGYSKEEFRKLGLEDLLADGPIIKNMEVVNKLLGGEPVIFYRQIRKKDGSAADVEINASLQADKKLLAFIRDITDRKNAERALKESELFSRSILTAISSHISVMDVNGTILAVNKAWSDFADHDCMSGLKRPATGTNYLEILKKAAEADDLYAAKALTGIQQVFKGETGSFEMEYPCHTFTQKQWFILSVNPFAEDSSRVVLRHNDISQRKNLEIKMQAALERYNLLAKATSDTVWDWDIKSDRIIYNEGITRMFGYDMRKIENTTGWWKQNVHPDDQLTVYEQIDEAIAGKKETVQMQYRYKCADGSYKYIFDRAILLYDKNFRPDRMIGAMQDVTYQKEEDMRIDRAIIRAQEEERKQIGMELHDNVNQLLSASLLYLSMADGATESNISFYDIVKNSRHNISEAIADIRRLSHQLAPATYEHIAVNEIFESLINSVKAARGFDIKLEVKGFENKKIQTDIQLNLYRVLQEQLNNIVKYSKAKKVDVQLICVDNKARLLIADDGVGFDPAAIKNGIGLENIRRRTKLFNGHVEINAAPGKGCKVLVELPFQKN